MLVRYSVLVLVHKSIRFVLNFMGIMHDCKCIVREPRLFEVILIRRRAESGVQFIAESLI